MRVVRSSPNLSHCGGRGTVLALALLALAGCGSQPAFAMPDTDPGRGRQDIQSYGCGACHVIPGVTAARGMVGPPLTNWARRGVIAGHMANTPDNLVRWIENPPAVEKGTLMPDLGVSEGQARDIAAYLYTLR
jgi:cytochrome c